MHLHSAFYPPQITQLILLFISFGHFKLIFLNTLCHGAFLSSRKAFSKKFAPNMHYFIYKCYTYSEP